MSWGCHRAVRPGRRLVAVEAADDRGGVPLAASARVGRLGCVALRRVDAARTTRLAGAAVHAGDAASIRRRRGLRHDAPAQPRHRRVDGVSSRSAAAAVADSRDMGPRRLDRVRDRGGRPRARDRRAARPVSPASGPADRYRRSDARVADPVCMDSAHARLLSATRRRLRRLEGPPRRERRSAARPDVAGARRREGEVGADASADARERARAADRHGDARTGDQGAITATRRASCRSAATRFFRDR